MITVQRQAINGWDSIGAIRSLSSNDPERRFKFFDKEPQYGVSSYRLQIAKVNAVNIYSPTRRITIEESDDIHISPNPASRNTGKLTVTNTKKESVYLTVTNSNGQPMKFLIAALPAGASAVIDISAFPKGIYILSGNSHLKRTTKKIIVN